MTEARCCNASAQLEAAMDSCDEHDGHDHSLSKIGIISVFGGLAFFLNSFLAEIFFGGDFYPQFFALIAAVFIGAPLVFGAVKALIHGHLHMEELAALAVIACISLEDYRTSAVVAFLMLTANLIESRQAKGAFKAIEGLIKLTPKNTLVKRDNDFIEIQVSELSIGDIVKVLPGDSFPADGVIIKGETTINEAPITGESLPVEKGANDEELTVFAGTVNLTGAVEVKIDKLGGNTLLGTVRELILKAGSTKIAVTKIVDKYIVWYTPVVLMLCAVILFFTKNMYAAITTLVIVCPCAFILATPTAMIAALSAAAKSGVLVKNAVDLEEAANIDAVVFDKTGTLTTGNLEVFKIEPFDINPIEFLKISSSVELHSRHPAALAVVGAAKRAKIDAENIEDFEEVHGKGVKAKYQGSNIIIGRATFLQENAITVPKDKSDLVASILHVAKNGKYIGRILMADKMRTEAKEAAQELRDIGVGNLTMLTGDRWEVANSIGKELGFTKVEAQCLPERKLEVVEEIKAQGRTVAVVGDGINDAPALAAGNLGIAMGALGSDIAIHSASITFMSSDLRRLPFLIALSKQTRKIIYQNFIFGIVFIVMGTGLAISNYIEPMQAALLHNIGSFFVIFNSARLLRMEQKNV